MLDSLDLEADGHGKHLPYAACSNARNVFIVSPKTISTTAKLRKLDQGLKPAIVIRSRYSTYGLYVVQVSGASLHLPNMDVAMTSF